MIVLTLNSGSTSARLAAFELQADGGPAAIRRERYTDHAARPARALEAFSRSLGEATIDAMAHRVVHGGSHFTHPVRIDAGVEAAIDALADLAPLHNRVALAGIQAARERFGDSIPQVAVFDTSFFATLPPVASSYAIPHELSVRHQVRRYGFHGLAHEAMLRRWCELQPSLPGGGRIITLQLGGGCSAAAIAQGQPIDTSMGFSPLEGLVMTTRSGDIDAAVVPYLAKRLRRSADKVVQVLNKQSGVLGLSGRSANLAELLTLEDPAARLAVELYCYRIKKCIGAYIAALGGCDGIVFGGGTGEHVPRVRTLALSGLDCLGIQIDSAANDSARGGEALLSASGSRVVVRVIPGDEEHMLARAAADCLSGTDAAPGA